MKNRSNRCGCTSFNVVMSKPKATWQEVAAEDILQRSSHIVSVISDRAYIFGGELRPREPKDNDVHVVKLGEGNHCR